MKQIVFGLLAIALLSACSKGPELKEEEVRKNLIGSYCKDRVKLELHEDGTYLNQRIFKGALSGTPVFERCEGNWKLQWEGGKWMLILEKSTKSNSPAADCKGLSQPVWDSEGLYAGPDSVLVLEEMLAKEKLEKGTCD